MKKKKLSLLWKGVLSLALLCLFSGNVFAQNVTVTGTVVDVTNEPLIGATVREVGNLTNGTITNYDGQFTLSVATGATLEVSYVGMKTTTVSTSGKTTFIITLEENTSVLDEVVVTGYSTQSRSQMTTSVSKLDTKVLESAPRSNVGTALQGTIAGLNVTQNTGQPGSSPTMVLRGGTSFDGTGSPLILIDGVPGSLYALNADDIESMEVLKDAASNAIYGARAANGVILVTTKKGKVGRSNITLRSKFTMNDRRSDPMEYLGAADYVKFNRMGVVNTQMVQNNPNAFSAFLSGANAAATGNNALNSIYTTMIYSDANKYLLNFPGWQTIDDPVKAGQKLIFQGNKMNELFYQDSYSFDNTLAFDGGNDKGTYYLGLGFMDDKGLVYESGFKRFSGTMNASYKITDDFKVSSNLIYAHSNRNLPYDTPYNLFQRTAGLAPTSRIYNNNADGSLSENYQPGTYLGFGNPLYYRDKFINYNLEQRLNASVQFDYSFLNNFTFTLRGSHFSVNNTNESFNKAYLSSGSLNKERQSSASLDRTLRNQATALLNYRNKFAGKHNVAALIGTEYFLEQRFSFSAATRYSPTDLIYTMNVGSQAQGVPTSSRTQYAIASLLGQVNYDYDYKYLVGLTFRNDGTSRLANQKWGFFPGISLGWNAHNEDFFKESSVKNYISKLKPRISYGVNGNIEVLSNFGVFGRYGTTSVYDGLTGYVNNGLPTLDLMWERSTTLNFGIDLGLFNDRVNLIGDYFIRDVQDKLAGLTLPLWTGFGSILTNNGTLQNKGLELQITADVLKTKDFKWTLGATFTQIKSYAKKLPKNGVDKNRQGGVEIFDAATGKSKYVGGLQEGERLGYDLITGYVFDGVYNTQDEIEADKDRIVEFAYAKNKRFLGDSRWKDMNGDNIINYLDRVVLGRSTPDFIGGLTSNLTYKNFGLFVKTDFAVGHIILNGRRLKGIAQTQGNQNGPLEIRDTWTAENATSDIPRFDLTDPQRNHRAAGFDNGDNTNVSSRYWEKGDYFAIRELTLSYTIDKKFVKNIFKDARIYLTGSNLAYINGFSGSSPEEAVPDETNNWERGLDRGRFPLPRTYTLGINLTF